MIVLYYELIIGYHRVPRRIGLRAVMSIVYERVVYVDDRVSGIKGRCDYKEDRPIVDG